MMSFIKRHPLSVFAAILLHLVVFLGFTLADLLKPQVLKVNLDSADNTPFKPVIEMTEPLKTFAVDASVVQEQLALLKQVEADKALAQKRLEERTQTEKQRLEDLKQKQAEEQKKTDAARQQAEAAKKIADAESRKAEESKRLAEIEKQKVQAQQERTLVEQKKAEQAKKETEIAEKKRNEAQLKIAEAQKQRQAEEEKTKQLKAEIEKKEVEKKKLEQQALVAKLQKEQEEEEAELRRALEAEASQKRAAIKSKEMQNLKETYVSSIAAKVKDNWRTAAKVSPDAQCDIAIVQTLTGDITSVKILNCNALANEQFRKDAEKAVYRSAPLPAPPVKELFERHIQFNFKP